MKTFIWTVAATVLLFLAAPAASRAEIAQRPPSVVMAEQYLNALTTARARFLQTAPNGVQLVGTFYLDRPGKLRFEYDAPVRDFIVADGLMIYFYDAELGEQTNAPIGQTLADFLLRDNLSLSGDVAVNDVTRSGDLLQITLSQSSDPDAGSIVLGFTEEPLTLKKWRVTDSTGAITEIELFQLETGLELASGLFAYSDPARLDKRRYND